MPPVGRFCPPRKLVPFPRTRWVDRAERRFFAVPLGKFLVEEGVAAWLRPAPRWSNGAVMWADGWEIVTLNMDSTPATVRIPSEEYGRIYRTLERGIPVTLELDIQNRWDLENFTSFNVVAEIPGTDRADEVVIMGAHLDSHLTGTGAGDDGAGVALVMEAARILKTLDLPMRRTVRVALFSSEETQPEIRNGVFLFRREEGMVGALSVFGVETSEVANLVMTTMILVQEAGVGAVRSRLRERLGNLGPRRSSGSAHQAKPR